MKVKHALAAAGIAAVTFLTSGCMSVTGDITLDDKAHATGNMEVTLNKQVASMAGISSAEAMKKQIMDGEDIPADANIAVTETDTDYVMTYEFENEVMDEEGLTAKVVDDGNVQFTYVNDGMSKDDAELFADMEIGNVSLTVNFPGEVLEYTGAGATKVDEDTVKWSFPATKATTATATSKVAPAAGSLPLGVITGVGVLAGAATLLVIGRRKARKQRAAAVGQAAEATVEVSETNA